MYTHHKILRPLALIVMAMAISATGCGKTGLGPDELPSAPTNFRITAIGDGRIALAWNATEEEVDHFAVYRAEGMSSSALGSYARVATTTEPRYEDRTLTYDREYRYRIAALAGTQESERTEALGGQPLNLLPPQRIDNLTVYARNIPQLNQLDVSLIWDSNTVDADLWGYRIYRGTASSFLLDETSLIESIQSGLSTMDRAVDPNVEYTYQVVAEDRGGKQSDPVSISVVVFNTPDLLTPSADTVVSASQVQFAWSETSEHPPIGYVVYLSTSPIFADAQQFDLTTRSMLHATTNMAPGRYYWQVGTHSGDKDRIVALSPPSSFILQK